MKIQDLLPILLLFFVGAIAFLLFQTPSPAPPVISPSSKTVLSTKTSLPPPEKTVPPEEEIAKDENKEETETEPEATSTKEEKTTPLEKQPESQPQEQAENQESSEEEEEIDEGLPQQPAMHIVGEWVELGKSWMNPKTKEVELKNKVRIHPRQQIVEVEGEVIVNEGLIELFACTERGKTHESTVILFCAPSHLQTGLMMLGLQPPTRGEFPGDPLAKAGDLIDISLSWKIKEGETEKVVTHPIYELIWNTRTKSAMSKQYWLFNGSFFSHDPIAKREVFVADISGNIVTTLHDPDTIIDSTHELRDDDTVFFANSNLLPPSGTPITMTFKPAPKDSK